jgi:hypothetical protein
LVVTVATPSDETNRFVFSGVVDLKWGIRIAPVVQWASARPYDSLQGIDVFGNGRNNSHIILFTDKPNDYTATKNLGAAALRDCMNAGKCFEAPYDTFRGQTFFQFDVRASKVFKIKERYMIDAFFQAFDLTNRANFGANYNGNVQSSQFQQPVGFITPSGVIVPRSFTGELGARFSF